MSACRKRKWMKWDSKKTETNCFVDRKQHETCSTIISLIKLLHSTTAGQGEVDLSMVVAPTLKVDGQFFPEDHEVMFGLKTGGCYTEHKWNLFRFVQFDELIVEFEGLSPKHSEVWNTDTQIVSNQEVHTKSQTQRRHLDSSSLLFSDGISPWVSRKDQSFTFCRVTAAAAVTQRHCGDADWSQPVRRSLQRKFRWC